MLSVKFISAGRRTLNLWAAIVRVVELFISGGKPGHALVAFLAVIVAIVIVAVGLTSGDHMFVGGSVDTANSFAVAKHRHN